LTCRSASFALVTAYVSALGHVWGGGGPPGMGPLLFAAALVGGTVSGLARTHRGPCPMLGLVVGAQLAYHLLFGLDAHDMAPLRLPQMLAFHAVAALLCALVLAGGDRALFRLFETLDRVVSRVLTAPSAPAVGPPPWPVPFDLPPPAPRWSSTAPRRGPPTPRLARINWRNEDEVDVSCHSSPNGVEVILAVS
jgi:hypothetical protein